MGQSTLANERKQLGTAGSCRDENPSGGKTGGKCFWGSGHGGGGPENCGLHQQLAEGDANVVRQQLHRRNNNFGGNLEIGDSLGQLLKSALLIDVECCGFGYDIWYQNTTNNPSPRP